MKRISSKKELRFYIMADMMMNRGVFKRSLKKRIRDFFFPDYTIDFLCLLRKTSYYYDSWLGLYYRWRLHKISMKMGYSISCNSCGYGLLLPHYGTIVVGENSIGNYAVLHTSTCISGNGKIIGNALYLATGAKMTSKVVLGDNVTVAANSVVTKSFPEGNVLLTGAPASIRKPEVAWYLIQQEGDYQKRVEAIECLRSKMGL